MEQKRKINQADMASKPQVWDCGSSLYDSFELKSFERQLDSAIHSRTLSMPHLSDRQIFHRHHHHNHQIPPPPPPVQSSQSQQSTLKKPSKISRSFQKLLRSVFKPKQNQRSLLQGQSRDGFYVVYDKSATLSTIPEVPEFDGAALSPEISSMVRRAASERFTAASIGISCA